MLVPVNKQTLLCRLSRYYPIEPCEHFFSLPSLLLYFSPNPPFLHLHIFFFFPSLFLRLLFCHLHPLLPPLPSPQILSDDGGYCCSPSPTWWQWLRPSRQLPTHLPDVQPMAATTPPPPPPAWRWRLLPSLVWWQQLHPSPQLTPHLLDVELTVVLSSMAAV